MATFVLIHGSWQASWCWRDVLPRLQSRGHEAVALDLPGHGADTTDLHAVTLRSYVDAIVAAIGVAREAPIVVGHSMGGIAMQAAEAVPERLAALVYISALIADDGTSLLDIVDGYDADYLAQIVWAADRRTAVIRPEGARRYLYPSCPQAQVDDAVRRLTPEPVAPFETALFTTARAASVPAFYVECLRDRILSRAMQRKMQARARVSGVFSLDCDHSPFFSAPEDLVAALHQVSEETAAARAGCSNGPR